MRVDEFFSYFGLAVVLGLAWFLFLGGFVFNNLGVNASANLVFYSFILGAYTIYGSKYFEEKYGSWTLILTTFAVGVLASVYFSQNGLSGGTKSVDNLIQSSLIAFLGTITFGGVVTATLGYYFWISDIPQRRAQKEQNNQAQSDFEAEFNQFSDDGFDFDEAEFSNSGYSSGKTGSRSHAKSSPRGFDDRHPDDEALWAYAYDETISDAQRSKAFKTILKRQNVRAGKTGRKVALINKKP